MHENEICITLILCKELKTNNVTIILLLQILLNGSLQPWIVLMDRFDGMIIVFLILSYHKAI